MFFWENLISEGKILLPLDVELDLYSLYNMTRNLSSVVFLSIAWYYAYTRKDHDDTQEVRRYVSFIALWFLAWEGLIFLIPFSLLSLAHPDLVFEIGGYMLRHMGLILILVTVTVVIVQVLNYRGYFRKRDWLPHIRNVNIPKHLQKPCQAFSRARSSAW